MTNSEMSGYVPEYRETADETITAASKEEKRAGKKRRKHVSREFEFKLTVLAIILLLIFAPVATYIDSYSKEETFEEKVRVEDIIRTIQNELFQEAYYASAGVLESRTGTGLTIPDMEDRIESKLDFIVQTELADRYTDIDDWSFEFKNLSASINQVPVLVSMKYGNSEGSEIGQYRSVPGYYNVVVDYELIGNNDDNGESIHRLLSFQVEVHDIYPFLEYSHGLIQLDSNTPRGRIQQMVSYMLTTLVRHRMKLEYGHGPYESPFNVLNEGDVELAVNLAILFEELYVLRQYDKESVSALDRYYRFARDPAKHADEPTWSPANPTGQRQWGSAEMENFDKLYSHVLNAGIIRSLEQLLDASFNNGGLLDPADVYALYLILDRELPEVSIDPGDDRALLDELKLWDPRTESDLTDVNNIKSQLDLSEPYAIEFIKDPGEGWSEKTEILTVQQTPDYLVSEKNIHIDGLTHPRGWYTDIKLTQTRTWGVPPDVAPPSQHNYRVQWDLDIKGEFDLNIGRLWKVGPEYKDLYNKNPRAYYTHDTWYNGTVKLDFPVTIYCWPATLPLNNGIPFYSLNPLFWDFNVTDTWIRTPSAQVKEYFNERLWQGLKPYISIAMDKMNNDLDFARFNILSFDTITGDGIALSSSEARYRKELLQAFEDTSSFFWSDLDHFAESYLWNFTEEERFHVLTGTDLWLNRDGFNISIEYSDDFQNVSFNLKHNAGDLKIIFNGLRSGVQPAEAFIELNMDTEQDVIATLFTDYKYRLPLRSGNPDTVPVFEGKIGSGGLAFDLNYKPDPFEVWMHDYGGFGLLNPDKIRQSAHRFLEQRFTSYQSGGTVQDIAFRIGLSSDLANESDLIANAESMAGAMAKASSSVFGLDDQGKNRVRDAQIIGYFNALEQNLQELEFYQELVGISIAFNCSYYDGSGELHSNEIGFSIRGSSEIHDFMKWLTFSGAELVSNIAGLPDTFPAIVNLMIRSEIPLSDDTVYATYFVIYSDIEDIYRIESELASAAFGRSAYWWIGQVMSGISSYEPHPMMISNVESRNVYSLEKSIGDIHVLTMDNEMIRVSKFDFYYGSQ